MMKTIVTGTRNRLDGRATGMVRTSLDLLLRWAVAGGERLRVVHGDARTGVDQLVKSWCTEQARAGNPVDQFPYPAQWTRFGKPAGRFRNEQMWAEHWHDTDLCLAFPAIDSKGTIHCVGLAARHDCPVWQTYVEAPSLSFPPRARLIPEVWNVRAAPPAAPLS